MSSEEQKLVDTAGDYMYAVKSGTPVDDPQWRSCRLVMTDKRLVLANSSGKQALPHSNIEVVGEEELPASVDPAGATPMRIGDNVVLVDAADVSDFELEYCRATLHATVILTKHPAVVGGVIQDEATWRKTRFQLDDDVITLAFPGGEETTFAVDDVGTVETSEQAVMGETRTVLEVEHTDEDDRSVETYFSGMDHHTTALQSLFERVIEEREGDYELDEIESQVLMALYSGVSPFEMSDFVGIPVDEVEEIYQKLLDVGAVDEVRTRTEVSLNAQGRNMASEAMNEQ
ncbi:CheF family chemotaxis protein [Halomicrobium sp. IBSBa]|uniref:CheF family chemotaxis protein n=1 Tax=Halomicrobium sp. IBSBa TaxID=2778916 RepID=UPI001ABFC152|nr:CheF family chemotaxis protein [Halomicrobium sp. IBSBa]MBO4249146.1 CheF family chemotaxis protein [Halomicrobium sp. IBSBa]